MNKYSYPPFRCPICHKEMFLDDVDYAFDGNQDNYWVCENCDNHCSLIERVRYGNRLRVKEYTYWTNNNSNEDITVNCYISYKGE